MGHEHPVVDTDVRFSIDSYTRTLIDSTPAKKTIVQYDHNSERYTFSLPRVIEGHDMTECDVVEVIYINIDGSTNAEYHGKCPISDLRVSEDDEEVLVMSWLVSKSSTQFVGPLHFSIRFACHNENGEVTYEWNTRRFTSINVVSGMGNREAIDFIESQIQDTIDRLNLEPAPQTYILVDDAGNEIPAVLTEEEVPITATANDIRLGTTAITSTGITAGEKDIPSYVTSEGYKMITPGSTFEISLAKELHQYTKLQAIFCPYNSSIANSVEAEKIAIDNSVYPAQSTMRESTINVVDPNIIDFGITNTSNVPWLIRYFTYKEVY